MSEQLAIVRSVVVGMGERGTAPGLRLEIDALNLGSTLIFSWERASDIVHESGVDDINKLKGRACVVDHDGAGSVMTFKRWHT